jgi:hypothetical protein
MTYRLFVPSESGKVAKSMEHVRLQPDWIKGRFGSTAEWASITSLFVFTATGAVIKNFATVLSEEIGWRSPHSTSCGSACV